MEKETPKNLPEEMVEQIGEEETPKTSEAQEEQTEPQPETEQEVSSEETSSEELLEKLQELEKKVKEYRARMEHHKKKQREYEQLLKEKGVIEQDPVQLVKLVKAFEGYSPEEIDFISTYAKGLGKSPLEVLNDEKVKVAIEAMRQKKNVEEATLPPSGSTIVSGKSPEQLTKEEIDALPQKEREKILAEMGLLPQEFTKE